MENTQILEVVSSLKERFGAGIQSAEMHYDIMTVEAEKSSVYDILAFLKNHPAAPFNFLTSMCGLHFPEAEVEKQMGLMYQLHSFGSNLRIRIKTYFADATIEGKINEMPTITTLWPAANWMERQEYDFFGFHFIGHPDLRRILNVEDMVMFPMRKEYPLEDQTREDKDDSMFGRLEPKLF